ncbi:MAG: hypothetical protein LUD16_04320, partial [Lachnospiraceae bacterium]|nr:hypothetical protein [Lachnospiraceae bacterium]
MKEKRSGLGKRFRKGLSLLLTLCLLAGLIPDAVFAEDETNAVTAEAGTEAAAGEAENTAEEAGTAEIAETETETETAAEAQSATEALTETAVTETDEISVETESGTVQETETETETESEATAGLLGSTAAVICGHSNDADTCMVCEVEALIAELPGVDEISAMDTDGQNEVYLQASDICDIYYDDLTEDERELVPNIGDLWEVLDYFSGAISLTATQNGNVSYIDAEGTTQTYSRDYYAVDSDSTTWGTDSTETWYVVNSSVEISDRIVVSGTVNLILEDGCTLTASSGITVNSGNTLIIYGQTSGTGTVSATATESYYAGIGGSKGNSCGTITINGGTVEATGGN